MIFYFSGTGNSQWAARRLGEALEDEVVSVNRLLKSGERPEFWSQRPLVFVAPTYAWRMPRVLERWIRDTAFTGERSAYFVLTCGGSAGAAGRYARRLCAEKGLDFRGLAQVVMPENYLALYPTPGEAECRDLLERAEPVLDGLAQRVRRGELFPEPRLTAGDILRSGPVNPAFYALVVRDRAFAVSDGCISCGKCVRRCPLNNVALREGKPVWRGHCTHCMACIGGCPVGAITYGEKSKGRRPYYIMEEEHPCGTDT